MASSYSQLGNYDSAEWYLRESLQLPGIDKEILIANYGRLGLNRKRQHQYKAAIEYYLKSLAVSQEINDSLSSAKTLANIGNVYREQDNNERALQYYLRALALLDSTRHRYSISGISIFVSDAYQALGKLDEAEKFLIRSISIVQSLGLPASEVVSLSSLGTLQMKQGKLEEAISSFRRAVTLQEKLGADQPLDYCRLQLAEAYLIAGHYDEAQELINFAELTAGKRKDPEHLMRAHKLLSQLAESRRDFESALNNFKQSVYYKDTLFTLEKANAVEELALRFEAQQKEKIIEEQKRIIKQQRTIELFLGIVIVVVLGSGTTVYFFIRQKQNTQLEMELERQRKQRLMAIVVAQEQMQQKIARDLHDGLVQVLGAAKISLESVRGLEKDNELAGRLRQTSDIIDRACHDARTLSHQLLPYSLEKHGLVAALEEFFARIPRRSHEVYEFSCTGIEERLQAIVEINLYRIVQELINNIAKHAAATRVQVYLSRQNNEVTLCVHDNGKGFDPSRKKFGAGLMNIESRLQAIKGHMKIESHPGAGTQTTIRISL